MRDPRRDRVLVCGPVATSFVHVPWRSGKKGDHGGVMATGWKASSLCKSKINAKKTLRQLGSNDPRVFTVSLLPCFPE